MSDFESSDLYFQPDDPAVWNPEKFSPQQRLKNFLPKWSNVKQHQHVTHSPSASRSSSMRYSDCSGMTCPVVTHHYLITATGDHTHNTTTSTISSEIVSPTILPVDVVLSEWPDSLTGRSTSSLDHQEVKEHEDEDDVESYCGSLTYSVESEFKHPHHNSQPSHPICALHHPSVDQHYFFPPNSVSTHTDEVDDFYEDALETLDEPDLRDNKKKQGKRSVHRNSQDCFPAGDCFRPLAWIGGLFRANRIALHSRWVEDVDEEDNPTRC
ncbi:hypothetical protein IV203_031357 [Nitzschia inconspicua]|uniref:Uncharacterized protein n=1 Tax=Nitzschia inconspicua TaxID=303405 RepID=A0A9K3LU35_9STRA|nr:hypothetical protein IV203_031357 [Nitzschia inconspicua]